MTDFEMLKDFFGRRACIQHRAIERLEHGPKEIELETGNPGIKARLEFDAYGKLAGFMAYKPPREFGLQGKLARLMAYIRGRK